MKTFIVRAGLVCLLACGCLWSIRSANAQTFTTLKQFGILTNMSGVNPYCDLVQGPDGALYGTTYGGEASFMHGTVFKVRPDGSGFTVIHWFTNGLSEGFPYAGLAVQGSTLFGTASGSSDVGNVGGAVFSLKIDGSDYKILKQFSRSNQVDGLTPMAKLIVSGDEIYGTAAYGGAFQSGAGGTVFRLKTDGSDFAVLKNLGDTNSDGAGPHGALVLADQTLYGTTAYGGPLGHGTVFKMNIDGSGYTVLHAFSADEGAPQSELTLSGTNLYGTTGDYGASFGTVFKLSTDGSGYSMLKHLTSTDGFYSYGGLALSSNQLYGMTYYGGISNYGTIFRINTDGTDFVVLKNFLGYDGANPYSSMSSIGGILYGSTTGGGLNEFGFGTLFKINPDGTDYTLLKQFAESDGRLPSPLIQSGDTLFGTTSRGGNYGLGIVFKLNTDGTDYQIIQHISPSNGVPQGPLALSEGVIYGASSGEFTGYGTVFKLNTNGSGFSTLKQFTNAAVEGAPPGGVTVSGSTLYGRTSYGGPSNYGTLFKMSTNGSDYTVLRSFSQTDGVSSGGRLTVSNNMIYAATPGNGAGVSGTIFSINTDGSGYRLLKEFSPSAYPWWTNSDGAEPLSDLVLVGNVLYGATSRGGVAGYGTAFKINTDGSGFTVLRQLMGNDDLPIGGFTLSDDLLYGSGSTTVFQMKTDGTGFSVLKQFVGYFAPSGPPVVSGHMLYSTTGYGGIWDYGTIFAIDLSGPLQPIPLNARRIDQSLVLDWRHAGFSLQAAPQPTGTYTNVPAASSPYTNPISGPARFFRLIGN